MSTHEDIQNEIDADELAVWIHEHDGWPNVDHDPGNCWVCDRETAEAADEAVFAFLDNLAALPASPARHLDGAA